MAVIDIHEHMRTQPHFSDGGSQKQFTSAEDLIASMDRRGIDRMAVLPFVSPEASFIIQSCEEVFEVCDRHPGRFIKFCNVDPRIGKNSATTDLASLLAYYKDLGARGLGEITCNLSWDDPRVHNLFAACEKVGLPATFHVATRDGDTYGLIDAPGLEGLERALQTFPGLTFLGHSQAFWSEVGVPADEEERAGYPKGKVAPEGRVPELMRTYPNLYGDLSAGSGAGAIRRDPEWGPRFINEFQDRLLMGMDLCYPPNDANRLAPDVLKDYLDRGAITREVYDKVMGGNAARLYDLDGA
jgi:hypothetical protein